MERNSYLQRHRPKCLHAIRAFSSYSTTVFMILYLIPSSILMPNLEPRTNLSGPLMKPRIVFVPSNSKCFCGLANMSKIFAAGVLITILADLIFELWVSNISARTGRFSIVMAETYYAREAEGKYSFSHGQYSRNNYKSKIAITEVLKRKPQKFHIHGAN